MGGRRFYPGRIASDNGDGTFAIAYDDGERESRVKAALIKLLPETATTVRRTSGLTPRDSDDFCSVGSQVEANYKGQGKWYKGEVTKVNKNETYDILYEDGDKERRVRRSRIRVLGGAASGKGRKDNVGDTRLPLGDIAEGRPTDGGGGGDYIDEPLEAGMLVTARYQGGAQWYDGRILRKCEADGFYDIRYDDGDFEENVPEKYIRVRNPTPRDAPPNKYDVGDVVEARYGGNPRGRFYRGKVIKSYPGGVYDLKYNNGESERRVRESLMRAYTGNSPRGTGLTPRGAKKGRRSEPG